MRKTISFVLLRTAIHFVTRSLPAIAVTIILVACAQSVRSQFPEVNILPIPSKAKPGVIKEFLTINYGDPTPGLPNTVAYASDDLYAYITTPGGLFRTQLPLTSSSSFVSLGFQNRRILNIYSHNNSLYILMDSPEVQGTPEHSFLRSDDQGATFVPIDNGLMECYGSYCWNLTSRNAVFKDNAIYLNAGSGTNLQVSRDNGASWQPLIGTLQRTIGCWDQSFDVIENRVLIGGDCLEWGYIEGGILRPNQSGWVRRPASALIPNLNLYSVNTLSHKPGTTDIYAGTAGGILKSTDFGISFRFVVKYSILGWVGMPSIGSLLYSSKSANLIVAGGNDSSRPFLAYSRDNGETWFNISARLESMAERSAGQTPNLYVCFVFEDATGKVLVGALHPASRTLRIYHLRIDVPSFR